MNANVFRQGWGSHNLHFVPFINKRQQYISNKNTNFNFFINRKKNYGFSNDEFN